jgi:hypothetical protein
MTHEQFVCAARRADRYSIRVTTWAMIGLPCGIALLLIYFLPNDNSGKPVRYQLLGVDEPIFNWIFCPLYLLIFGTGALLPVWFHYRYGVVCAACGKSVTLHHNRRGVLKSGSCPWCQEPVFEPAAPAEGKPPVPWHESVGLAVAGGFIGGALFFQLFELASLLRPPTPTDLTWQYGFGCVGIVVGALLFLRAGKRKM